MFELAAISIVGLLVALIIAALVYVIAAMFLPQPVPVLLALLVLVVALLGHVTV